MLEILINCSRMKKKMKKGRWISFSFTTFSRTIRKSMGQCHSRHHAFFIRNILSPVCMCSDETVTLMA